MLGCNKNSFGPCKYLPIKSPKTYVEVIKKITINSITIIQANHGGKKVSISLWIIPTTNEINNRLTKNPATQGVINSTYFTAFAETKNKMAIKKPIMMFKNLCSPNNFVLDNNAEVTLKTNKNPKTGIAVEIPVKSIVVI